MSVHTPHEAIINDPKQLPVMHPGKLIGRETILAQIYTHLKANTPVLIHGAAGVGKTALAATLATAYAAQPGGVLWMTVDHPPLEELLVRVGRAFNVSEITNTDTPLGMVGAVENTLKARKPFIVIDGAIDAGILSRFITRCADGLPLLATSPVPLDGIWETVMIPVLEIEGAAALFKREGRVAVNEFDDDVFEIVHTVGTTPFGVIVAARAMLASKQTPDAFLKLLGQVALSTKTSGVPLALTASFRALNGALQGLVLMMGALFPNGATPELLSLVSGAAEDSVEQAMTILAQLHMVERTTRYGVHHYRMHALTHEFARRYLVNAGKLDGLQTKVRDSVLAYGRKYADGNQPDKLAAEIESFLAAALWAQSTGDRQTALELASILSGAGDFVTARGYAYEVLRMRDLSDGVSAFSAYGQEQMPVVPLIDDEDDESSSIYAVDEDALEPIDDDEFDDDFDEEDTDDPAPEDFLPTERAVFSRPSAPPSPLFDDEEDDDDDDFGDEDESASESFLSAGRAPIFARPSTPPSALFDDDEDDEADFDDSEPLSPEDMMVASAGPLPALDDETWQDESQVRNLLAEAKRSGDVDRRIDVLKTLGAQQVKTGMENEAIATYNEVLDAYEEAEDDDGILEALDMLSALMVKTQNPQPAIMHASRGVRLAQDMGDDVTLIQLYMTLGDARGTLGESPQAIRDYGSALALARQNDDKQHEAIILYKLGYAQLDDGDAETAVDTLEQALALFKEQGKRDYEGRVMGGLGSAFSDLARWSEAMRFHTSALYIAREVADRDEESLQLASLAYAAVQANQLGDAVLRYRQALHLALEAENKDNIVSLIVDLARLLLRSKKYAGIADMLISTAEEYEPNDRDVLQLRGQVDDLLAETTAGQKPVKGDARVYAANAYQLLEG